MTDRFATFATLAVLTAAGFVLPGCGARGASEIAPPFAVEFSATSDDGEVLPGVTFTAAGHELGTTDASGKVERGIVGTEGQMLQVSVACPAGYVSEDASRSLRLARTHRIGTGAIEPGVYRTTCTRKLRDVVVVVRAEKGESLPVSVDGKPSGTTSADGTAHVLVRVDRDVRTLGVSLDTHARRDLRPQNPSRTFELGGRDSIVVFEQGFAPTPRARPRVVAPPTRHVPYRVD